MRVFHYSGIRVNLGVKWFSDYLHMGKTFIVSAQLPNISITEFFSDKISTFRLAVSGSVIVRDTSSVLENVIMKLFYFRTRMMQFILARNRML